MQQEIKRLIKCNHTKKEISSMLGIGYSTVRKYSMGVKSTIKKTNHHCTDCGVTTEKSFYGKMKNRCKQCHNKRGYESQKKKIMEYAASRGQIACSVCGYDRTFAALEWHHRNPEEKDPTWNRGWNMQRLKDELDKCDLVCANCHREIHAGLIGGLTLTRTGT